MEKIYRDSVHNIIRLEAGTAEGELLIRLIDAPEFQRLRRIRQLGLAMFAYQGAEHSRFTHSLGAMHLATRILDRLVAKYKISKEGRIAVRVAALLHDIGHGPFSHFIEPIFHFRHEDFTTAAVLSKETEVGKILSAFSAQLPQDVADIINGNFRPAALAQLVSSQLDVDRMDYLLRDALMTGAKYGIFDIEWIVKSLEIDEANDRLYVATGGIYAVEDYLQARYYMFRQVYFHRTLHSAEAVLSSLLRRAMQMFGDGKSVWCASAGFEKFLRGEHLALKEHLALDDTDVMFHIKRWEQSEDAILADLSARFLNRRLFKAFDLDMPEAERQDFLEAAKRTIESAGFDPEYYFIESRMADAPYYFYDKGGTDPNKLIYVEDGYSRPEIHEISEVSAAVRGLQRGDHIHRISFPQEVREEISKLYRRYENANASVNQ